MTIGVIGGGGWGTALASILARKGHAVRLWVYEADLAARMAATRVNDVYLPGIELPAAVQVTTRLADAASGAEMILLVTPSHALRATATALAAEARGAFAAAPLVVVATKGIEKGTLRRMSEVVAETLPAPAGEGAVVLAGPSHAEEVALQVPAAIVAACRDHDRAAAVQEACSTESLRIYTNDDVVGVEIGVSLKNVVAIAAGISDGLGFGDSTKAALLTRGLAEMARLGRAMGARPETFAGLAGMGDLIATATSRHSRNRRLGEAVGRGATLSEALAASPMVSEGVGTCEAAVELSRRHGVELPIAEQVHAILFEGKSARAAMRELLTRDLKPEAENRVRRES
ncbi:MAG TPA: NAD(P)H-dependent glycerol-3-phosphate dehydrogenase [Candidatus Eisenbacteria bacterium]|nr:NAD(P)H-dependent glycerol-3-phosphate dehydrogenase [Candidatus Eisenbacteria bacterium]